MAEYKRFTYSNTGTEITFMQGLIDLVCSLDTNITCEDVNGNPTTAALQYADLTSASQATFYFNFGQGLRWCFQRRYTNNQSASSYIFFVENGAGSAAEVIFTPNSKIPTASATRAYLITYIKSDNLIIFWIGRYNNTDLSSFTGSLIKLTANDSIFVSSYNSATILSGTLSNGVMSGTLSSILNYSADSGGIDYIKHINFVSGGAKQFDTNEIYSCSTVSQFSSIALPDGKNYFAIGTNAMVEVDPTT